MKKFATAILIALVSFAMPLFAQGAIEYDGVDQLVRVVETLETESGWDVTAIDTNGEEIIFHTDDKTKTDIAIPTLQQGDVLSVRNSGMMTMSLPPQTYAVRIRDARQSYELGLFGDILPESLTVEAGEKEVTLVSIAENGDWYDLVVEETATGETIIYHTSDLTDWGVEPALLAEGDTLYITDDGIAMLSYPAQMNALGVYLPKTIGDTRRVAVHSVETVDGETWINAVASDSSIIRYRVSDDTLVSGDISSLKEGQMLEITDDGRMTRSLPPQTNAVTVKVLTADIATGAALPFDIDSLIPRFGYTYGWIMMDQFIQQNLTLNAGYFARGIIDIIDLKDNYYMTPDEINAVIKDYLDNYWAKGVPGVMGPVYTSIEEIEALPAPETIEERFAYGFGFLQAYQQLTAGVDLDRVAFPYGALARLYDAECVLTPEQLDATFTEYLEYKQAVYDQWFEETKVRNLEDANKTLSEQAEVEGAIVLSDGKLVVVPNVKNEDPGAQPALEDTVKVNYVLHDLDGRTLDQGSGAEFPLQNVIPGFRDAVASMHVGDVVTAFVHPDIGYGVEGSGNVLPNSLLIFDIELLGIVTE